jgi:hypothetical protein
MVVGAWKGEVGVDHLGFEGLVSLVEGLRWIDWVTIGGLPSAGGFALVVEIELMTGAWTDFAVKVAD